MEPYDPISQLTMCCFGRRPRSSGFKTEAIRNQYLYSPSMAHIGPGNTTTWPMTQPAYGPMAPFGLAPSQPQPYILFTQPMIITAAATDCSPSSGAQQSLGHQQGLTTLIQQPFGSLVGAQQQQVSPMHKVPSMAASQYAIYASCNRTTASGMPSAQRSVAAYTQALPYADTIYEAPRLLDGLVRNRSTYLGPIAEASTLQQQQQQQIQPRPRALNRDIFKRLEIIEKQVDLTRDMDLVERHGLVITRAIEARSLAPHLTDETLHGYQEHFLMSDDFVIRFIEIIKRPGQTLGLYIRLVHFEHTQQPTRAPREGIVITKIESNSPVYTSQVLHIGDEILSINLIDIQGMSLDDVVTLMSIPKRLVLTLRVPRGRDPQLRATYAPNQHQQHPFAYGGGGGPSSVSVGGGEKSAVHQLEDDLEYDQRARIAARQQQQFQQQRQEQQQQQQQQQQQAAASRAALGPQASQLNFSSFPTNRQEYPSIDGSADGQPMRPLRVQSTVPATDMGLSVTHEDAPRQHQQQQQQQFKSSDGSSGGGGEQIIMRPSDFMAASRSMQQAHNNIRTPDINKQPVQISSNLSDDAGRNSPFALINERAPSGNGDRMTLAMRIPLNQFERQITTSQPALGDNRSGNVPDGFREFSVESEIASLEREAMNKDRQLGNDQQMPFEHRVGGSGGNASLLTQPHQAPSTLPRRTLLYRPDLGAQDLGDDSLMSHSIGRRPVINNIRLGETSEQSSYFSSSIDAINRELKELRRQRMALGDNDPGISEESEQNPKSSN